MDEVSQYNSDSKKAKFREIIQIVLNFFSIISKGLMKIVEEITSLIVRR